MFRIGSQLSMLEKHCHGALTHLGTSLSLHCYSIVFAWTHKVSFGFLNWIVTFFLPLHFQIGYQFPFTLAFCQIGYHFLQQTILTRYSTKEHTLNKAQQFSPFHFQTMKNIVESRVSQYITRTKLGRPKLTTQS